MITQFATVVYTIIGSMFVIQSPACGQWPTMRLDALEFVGGQIGTTIDIRLLAGSGCETANAFVDDFSISENSFPGASNLQLPFHLQSQRDTVPGFYPIRLRGPLGLSNSRCIWLTKEPWQAVPPDNNSPERSFPVGSGIIYSGRFQPRKEVYFQLNLPEQTHWRLDCTTRGIDSQAVVLLDIRGPANEPVSVVACKGFSDKSIAFEAKQPGRYLLKLSDQLYRGGPEFPYAIQLSQQASSVDLPNVKPHFSLDRANAKMFSEPSALLAAKIDTSRPLLVHHEHEFNDNHPMPIDFNNVVSGRFDNPRDKDSFEVFLEEGKSIAIDTLSNHLSQATDIKISVFPPFTSEETTESKPEKNISAADVDDQVSIGTADLTLRSSDPCFVFTAKEEGLYRIVLYDQQRSPQDVYRQASSKNYYLQLRNPQPDFELLSYFAAPASKPGESIPVPPTLFKKQIGCIEVIAIRRDGFAGPIEVHIDKLPDGVSCKPVVIESGSNQSSLMIDGTQLDLNQLETPLRIFGKPIQPASTVKSSPSDQALAYAAEITHGPIPTRPVPLARLIPGLSLATSTAYAVPIAIRIESHSEDISTTTSIQLPILTPPKNDATQRNRAPQEKKLEARKHKLFVRVVRGQGADQPVVIHGYHIPKGVSLSELTIQGDQSEGELEMTIVDATSLANFELVVIGETKLQANAEKVLDVQLWSLPRSIELIPQESPQP
ncbi:MAG: hypothetical protein NTW52_05060 [Planctomycetota bacterium]|nr:hypothetical protein [Planctomycetota bacterium]